MEDIEKLKKIIESHEVRISKLEKKLSIEKPVVSSITNQNDYSGIKGGIMLLLDNKFLDEPKSVQEIISEMKREGYYHDRASIDSTLRKVFIKNRTLQRVQEEKKWKYVIRK